MLIEGQLVEVTVSAKTLKHYAELGYDVKCNDVIMVPPEHLTRGSHAIVDVECDICKKIIQKKYKQYLRGRTYNMDACSECYAEKIKLSCLNKYGVENVFQLEEVKQKTKNTLLNTYGCDHPMHNDEIKGKLKQTNLEKYGVEYALCLDVVKEKIKNTLNFTPASNGVNYKKRSVNSFSNLNVDTIKDLEDIKNTAYLFTDKRY